VISWIVRLLLRPPIQEIICCTKRCRAFDENCYRDMPRTFRQCDNAHIVSDSCSGSGFVRDLSSGWKQALQSCLTSLAATHDTHEQFGRFRLKQILLIHLNKKGCYCIRRCGIPRIARTALWQRAVYRRGQKSGDSHVCPAPNHFLAAAAA